MGRGVSGGGRARVGKSVGVGAGLDDVAAEGEPVERSLRIAGVGEGLGPAGEGLIRRDRGRGLLFAFGQDLEEELGTAAVSSAASASSLANLVARVYLTRKPAMAASVPSAMSR